MERRLLVQQLEPHGLAVVHGAMMNVMVACRWWAWWVDVTGGGDAAAVKEPRTSPTSHM